MIVVDNFCSLIDEVRQSALASGFGTWHPNKGEVGSSIYAGMNFWGLHAPMLKALSFVIGAPVYPNNMFFRVTNEDTEAAYVHSDREWGDFTCIVYLSKHKEQTGTRFYRNRESGMTHMPAFADMAQDPEGFEKLKQQMVRGSEEDWELLDFIHGGYNRAVIFDAPRFHARYPNRGFSTNESEGRMVWACHFVTGAAHG